MRAKSENKCIVCIFLASACANDVEKEVCEEIGWWKTSANGGDKCVTDALCMSRVAKLYLGVVKVNPRLADLVPM
jgi:hypothetical protein